jgi:hypothetical protein
VVCIDYPAAVFKAHVKFLLEEAKVDKPGEGKCCVLISNDLTYSLVAGHLPHTPL